MNRATPKLIADSRDTTSELSLGQLIEIFRRRWRLVALITTVVLVAVIAVTFLLTPRYEATAQIKLDPLQRQAIDLDKASQPSSPQSDQARIDSEVQVLQSRNIAHAVADQLGLAHDPEFNKKDVPVQGKQVPEAVVDEILNSLTVKAETGTYIIDIGFSSKEANKAAAIANAFVDNYQQDSVNRRTQMAARQTETLDKRLQTLGGEVQAQEAEIARYRAASGIVQGTSQGTITDQQISSLSGQVSSAEAQAAAARASLAAAQRQIAGGGLDAVSSVLNSGVVADLRRQRAEVSREAAEVNARYGPKHPESLKVAQQLGNIDAALHDESRRIVSGLESQAHAADASAASLRAELNRLRAQQAANTRAGVIADGLERQSKATQNIYDQVAQTAQQSNQAQQNFESLATVIERAVAPLKPAFPNRPLFAALGLMLGLIMGVSLALLLEFLTNTVRSADDVELRLGVPFIVSIPRLTPRQLRGEAREEITPADFVTAKPMSSYAEALRTIRSTLVLSSGDTTGRAIAISSALPGEGKTTTALALGRIMAASGDRAIFVDCDLRRGGISALVAGSSTHGLIEVLGGKVPLEQAIVKDSASNLALLPLTAPSFTPVDLFSGRAMKDLLAELCRKYEYVLLDTPPVLAVADARIIASLSSAVLFVVRAEYTPRRAALAALDILAQDGTPILGGALSMVSSKSAAVTPNDPAYYYRKYRSYHTE